MLPRTGLGDDRVEVSGADVFGSRLPKTHHLTYGQQPSLFSTGNSSGQPPPGMTGTGLSVGLPEAKRVSSGYWADCWEPGCC